MKRLARIYTACVLSLAAAPLLIAQDSPDEKSLEDLYRRIEELESRDEPSVLSSDWLDRFRISGSANTGYYAGQNDSVFRDQSFQVWDARLFFEADLGSDAQIGETTLFRNMSFFFEWNLIRLGKYDRRSETNVGELYVDIQGVLDSDWLSLAIGRFQLPLGESYLRYSKGYANKPFISSSFGPWYWDEGIRLSGHDGDSKIGYVASVTNAENDLNMDVGDDLQGTLKVYARPTSWLYVSASGLRSGHVGASSDPAPSSLWLGETLPMRFGSSGVNLDNGMPLPPGPDRLESVTLWGLDAVIQIPDLPRIWLAYGTTNIKADGPRVYDRRLFYWIAEAILEGETLREGLEPFYAGLRANGLGTYDRDEGYLLDLRYRSTLGFNMSSLEAYSLVLGWRLTKHATLRAEYTWQDIDLVRGVSPAVKADARSANYAAIELGIQF